MGVLERTGGSGGWHCRQKGRRRNGWKDGVRVGEKLGGWMAERREEWGEGGWKIACHCGQACVLWQ